MSKIHTFRDETVLPVPLEELFPFFSNAANLQRITPDKLQFRILSPHPITMKTGARIDYIIKLLGIPFKWQTEITEWEPPFRFRDVQLRGPFKLWDHTHHFQAESEATRMIDEVRYQLPFAPLAPLVHRLFVQRQIRHIFAWRKEVLFKMFGRKNDHK